MAGALAEAGGLRALLVVVLLFLHHGQKGNVVHVHALVVVDVVGEICSAWVWRVLKIDQGCRCVREWRDRAC